MIKKIKGSGPATSPTESSCNGVAADLCVGCDTHPMPDNGGPCDSCKEWARLERIKSVGGDVFDREQYEAMRAAG